VKIFLVIALVVIAAAFIVSLARASWGKQVWGWVIFKAIAALGATFAALTIGAIA
jgi:hypothetical protein